MKGFTATEETWPLTLTHLGWYNGGSKTTLSHRLHLLLSCCW